MIVRPYEIFFLRSRSLVFLVLVLVISFLLLPLLFFLQNKLQIFLNEPFLKPWFSDKPAFGIILFHFPHSSLSSLKWAHHKIDSDSKFIKMILGRGYFINFDDLSSILDFTLVLTKVPWLRPLVCPAIIHHNLIDNYQMCMKNDQSIFVELRRTIH